MLSEIWLSAIFLGVLEILAIQFPLDQFLYESSIFVLLIDCICPPCNRGVHVFSHVGQIPSVLHLKYFFFFSVDIATFCVRQMILLAVCTSNFLQAIFLHVVRVFFTILGICQLSSTGFPVVSKFLALEASQGVLGYTFQTSEDNS